MEKSPDAVRGWMEMGDKTMKNKGLARLEMALLLGVALILMFAMGCQDDPVLGLDEDEGTADSAEGGNDSLVDGDDTESGGDTGEDSEPDWLTGSREEYCAGSGPTVKVGDQSGSSATQEVCTGDLAASTFRFAICSCKDADSAGVLRTDSFDSSLGPFTNPSLFGGAVGVNRNLFMPGDLHIGGTLIMAGGLGAQFPGVTRVDGDLKVKGPLNFAGVLEVARDVHVGGVFTNFGAATIGGDLYLGGIMVLPGLTNPNGKIVTGPVKVPPPCACQPNQLLAIKPIVKDARTNNHNADTSPPLGKNDLAVIIGDVTVPLPCGRYYVNSVGGAGNLTLEVHGRTALFVDGEFNLVGNLNLDLGTDGELDVFVSGNFRLTGNQHFGEVTRPAAVRFYVAGAQSVTITGNTGFVGNLYAPNATVIATGNTHVYGSIFAGDFIAMGNTSVHYDRDVLTAGEDCEEDPPTNVTETCVQYGETCKVDEDCCEPLICDEGICDTLLVV